MIGDALSRSTSTRTTRTPAAFAALRTRCTSLCLNVLGLRLMSCAFRPWCVVFFPRTLCTDCRKCRKVIATHLGSPLLQFLHLLLGDWKRGAGSLASGGSRGLTSSSTPFSASRRVPSLQERPASVRHRAAAPKHLGGCP